MLTTYNKYTVAAATIAAMLFPLMAGVRATGCETQPGSCCVKDWLHSNNIFVPNNEVIATGGGGGAGGAGGSADASANSYAYGGAGGQGGMGGQGGIGQGGSVGDINIIGGNVRVPVMPAPAVQLRYISPPVGSAESIAKSRFNRKIELTTPKKLLSECNVGRIFGILGPLDWGKYFDMEPKIRFKSQGIQAIDHVLLFDLCDHNDTDVELGSGSIEIGEFHAWTKGKYLKDEEQTVKACVYRLAREYGANVCFYYAFSDDVNMGKSAVLGGGGVQVGRHSSGMGTGGFGTTSAFVLKRANVRVRGYYVPHIDFEQIKEEFVQ